MVAGDAGLRAAAGSLVRVGADGATAGSTLARQRRLPRLLRALLALRRGPPEGWAIPRTGGTKLPVLTPCATLFLLSEAVLSPSEALVLELTPGGVETESGWELVYLRYQLPPPLQIFLHREAQAAYTRLFKVPS